MAFVASGWVLSMKPFFFLMVSCSKVYATVTGSEISEMQLAKIESISAKFEHSHVKGTILHFTSCLI